MTRVALYARYSSDNQRDASIEDQLRLCREHAERQGWTVVDSYSDRAISEHEALEYGSHIFLVARQPIHGLDKPVPKDADVLVTIDAAMDLSFLARLGRRLKGAAQTINLGADIFLADRATATLAASATTESATHARPSGHFTAASGNT